MYKEFTQVLLLDLPQLCEMGQSLVTLDQEILQLTESSVSIFKEEALDSSRCTVSIGPYLFHSLCYTPQVFCCQC
jgi:hypothetical protein